MGKMRLVACWILVTIGLCICPIAYWSALTTLDNVWIYLAVTGLLAIAFTLFVLMAITLVETGKSKVNKSRRINNGQIHGQS